MCDYKSSTQLNNWLFSPEDLEACRKRANQEARSYLFNAGSDSEKSSPPVTKFACGYNSASTDAMSTDTAPATTPQGHPYLEPEEEASLVTFYVAKIPSLLGPYAQHHILRRDTKSTATAALLFRRFYLSNSVMLHDPKHISVAAVFTATKVEDCLTRVQDLEEGTKKMNAPVLQADILRSEYTLLGGINCDLLCFHPYKAVLAFTEDLRTFLKGKKGRVLATFAKGKERAIVGKDLKPIHDGAHALVDDVMVSDVPLLYSPGQIGLAALLVSSNQISDPEVPKIDILGYIEHRFTGEGDTNKKSTTKITKRQVLKLSKMITELKEGKFGCANHQMDLQKIKSVYKKLKKCRGGEKKKKKRKAPSADSSKETSSGTKKIKTEE